MDISKLEDLEKNGRLEEAELSIKAICLGNPDALYPLQVLGIIQKKLNKFSESLQTHESCIELEPKNATTWNNKGCLLDEKSYLDESYTSEALICFENALKLYPNYTDALASLASVHLRLSNFQDAERYIQKALTVDKKHFIARRNQIALEIGKNNEITALKLVEDLIQENPESAELFVLLGIIHRGLKNPDSAKRAFKKALSFKEDLIDGMIGLGNFYKDQEGLGEAIQYYEKCLQEYSDSRLSEIRWNLSLLQLKSGDYENGWKNYEYRWERKGKKEKKQDVYTPEWNGAQDIKGKKIFIYREQGFGDQIFFMRYVEHLKKYADQITVQCDKRLAPLFSTISGIDVVEMCSQTHDLYISICSLPLAYGNLTGKYYPFEQLPSFNLNLDHQKYISENHFQKKLNIGFAFSGNKDHPQDTKRSISLGLFSKIFEVDANFHCLQIGLPEEDVFQLQRYRNVTQWNLSFLDTAYLMRELDYVIAVDTSLAHLAGSISTPTYLLLHTDSDFRWGYGTNKTPWYSSIRLIRQNAVDDWPEVINRLIKTLKALK